MIYDKLENASVYSLGPAFEKAIAFVRSLNADAALGRHEIDGARMYANVMEYETSADRPVRYEVHRKYADLQAVITGSEAVYARIAEGLAVQTPYNPEKDCEFLAADGKAAETALQLFPGYFTLLFPQDAHMGKGETFLGKSKLKKVVVKIALDELHR